jgi:hypothetical protein
MGILFFSGKDEMLPLSCVVITPALRDTVQKAFGRMPGHMQVHLWGASQRWPSTADK